MKLQGRWEPLLAELRSEASPLERNFFRSVEMRHAHPDDVLSGEGTRRNGGRFVRPGVRAVYLASDEETAFCEVTARKHRLAGHSQIQLTDYPRVTYVVQVRLKQHIDLAGRRTEPEVGELVSACLASDIRVSQAVGEAVCNAGVQGIVYPSAVPECKGTNLVAFQDILPRPELKLVNRDRVIALFKEWSERG